MGLQYLGTSQAVIDAPGDYTIDRDLTLTDRNAAAVLVRPGVHYVTIRLRSRLVCASGPATIARGIEANGSAALTIINDGGSIKGFYFGIRLSNCYLARLINPFIPDCMFRGIQVDGDDAMIDGADVRNVGGTTFSSNALCIGVEVSGARPKILRSLAENVRGVNNEAVGFSITDRGMGGIVSGCVAKCDVAAPHLANGNPGSYGLWVGGASDVVAANNVFWNWGVGAAYSSPPSGLIDENTYRGCEFPVFDGGKLQRGDGDPDSMKLAA